MLLIICSLICIQDKEDDLKVGVKSTALRFGDSTKEWVGGFGIVCISSLALSGFNADIGKTCLLFHPHYFTNLLTITTAPPLSWVHGAGWPYYVFLAAASGQLAWQIWTVDLSSRADCNRK